MQDPDPKESNVAGIFWAADGVDVGITTRGGIERVRIEMPKMAAHLLALFLANAAIDRLAEEFPRAWGPLKRLRNALDFVLVGDPETLRRLRDVG